MTAKRFKMVYTIDEMVEDISDVFEFIGRDNLTKLTAENRLGLDEVHTFAKYATLKQMLIHDNPKVAKKGAGLSRGVFNNAMQMDQAFATVVTARVADRDVILKQQHREAAQAEGKLTQFHHMERTAMQPDVYANEAIARAVDDEYDTDKSPTVPESDFANIDTTTKEDSNE